MLVFLFSLQNWDIEIVFKLVVLLHIYFSLSIIVHLVRNKQIKHRNSQCMHSQGAWYKLSWNTHATFSRAGI